MAISINPTLPIIPAQSATGAPNSALLVPGTVVNAEVLKLAETLVQIAIAGFVIDVASEVPLAVGQKLQLAVSQTDNGGVRLSIVGQGTGSADVASANNALAPDTQVGATASTVPVAPAFDDPLTPLQRIAVSVASEAAATRQQGLSPLFANLVAASASNSLPAGLQQAIVEVLTQRTTLGPTLAGQDIQNAFQRSGLFLEASLASPLSLPASGTPDLKAALIVLRQALGSMVGTTQAPALASSPATTEPAQAATTRPAAPAAAPGERAPPLAPELLGAQNMPDVLPRAERLALPPQGAVGTPKIILSEALLNIESGAATTATVLNLVQEAAQETSRVGGQATTSVTLPDGRSEDVTLRTLTPSPPLRGALPSAQPVAAATIAQGAPLATIVHRLLDDTEGALARQTLLQVASLPGGSNPSDPRVDPSALRWNFEIPFASPQGTAMAQFEISRDGGGGNEVEPAAKVWRARFSLDVEPAGPVHALVTFSGERTSVRLWAERPQTAARLRAGSFELSQALARAELSPGEIVIREGTPPQAAPAKAGYFLDRAL